MSKRPQCFQQSPNHQRDPTDSYISEANETSMYSGDGGEDLAAIAATHVPVLSDDLFNVIRAIVPPPPTVNPVNVPSSNAVCNSRLTESLKPDALPTEKLYTRRPTERSLLERLHNQISFLEETRVNMEELFIQLIEPKKYRNQDDVMNSIMSVLWKWTTDSTIWEQTLACLVSMSEQCSDLCLPQDAVVSTLGAMKNFPKNELVNYLQFEASLENLFEDLYEEDLHALAKCRAFLRIQRLGIKLFKNKQNLNLVKKVDVACMTFDSLCNLSNMDDVMMSAEYFIRELDLSERAHIRSFKKYILMLLNFPNRRNDKITVCLCWSALDILIMLAECNLDWDIFTEIRGTTIVQMLSLRPELEDRCKILLHKVLSPLHTNILFSEAPPIQQTSFHADRQSSEFTLNLPFEASIAKRNNDNAKGIPRGLLAGNLQKKVENGHSVQLKENIISDIEINQHVLNILPVDELITQKPPTPPPTEEDLDDIDGQFSDEECMQASNSPHSTKSVSPLLLRCAPSPSYSPPPETSLLLEDERFALGELLSCGDGSSTALQSVQENTSKCEPKMATVNGVIRMSPCDVVTKEKRNHNPASNGKLSSVFKCFICNESKGRRPLLVQQLKQVSHCLLEPRNSLLLNCLKSNLCEHHNL